MDYIDIIILALIIGASAVSSYKKKAKEQAKKKSVDPNESLEQRVDREEGSPWDTIIRDIEKEFSLEEKHESKKEDPFPKPISQYREGGDIKPLPEIKLPATEPSYADVFSYDKSSIQEIEQRRSDYEKSIEAIKKDSFNFTKDLTKRDNIKSVEISDTISKESITDEKSQFIKDFDLRDAILYSEILKPKFKEF